MAMRLKSSLTSLVKAIVSSLLLCCLLATCHAQPVVVTVATQNLQEMQELTKQIDAVSYSLSEHGNATRVLLGAIEATMSRVVDSENSYLASQVQTVPTMTLLQSVDFDENTRTWQFKYDSMVVQNDLNSYQRILYLSKGGNMDRGDTQNPCLGTTDDGGNVPGDQCVTALTQQYYVANVAAQAASTSDRLNLADISTCAECDVTVDVVDHENTVKQTITISIPHMTVRDRLAKTETYNSVTWGDQRMYSFGIGMLFVGSGKHVVISDKFSIIENSIEQVSLTKFNTYSIAKHMSFWSSQAAETDIRIVTIEYLLEEGFSLQKIDVSMNEKAVTPQLCGVKNTAIQNLANPSCLTKSTHASP